MGGDGADILMGRGGDDILDGGGSPADTASYAEASSGVTVDLGIAGPQNTGDGNDTLIGIENLTGSPRTWRRSLAAAEPFPRAAFEALRQLWMMSSR